MDPKRIAAEVDSRLRAASTPARRKKNEAYFPSSFDVLGVEGKHLKAIVRDLRARLKREDPAAVVAVARAVIGTGTVEGRLVAYELLGSTRSALATLDLADVEALGRGMDNWVSVDTFSVFVAGHCWREGLVPDSAIRRWARSRDRWWRRAAVVSTVALNQKSRGGTGDAKRTLEICALVASDRDDMVAKGLSWALRKLSEWDRRPVRAFLDEHASVLPARVRREVRHKLATGRKS
jgi:3-methyladenine DNA glycosylase AlkD